MASSTITIDLGVKIRWWVKPLMYAAAIGAWLVKLAVHRGIVATVTERKLFERSSYVAPDTDVA